MKLLTLNTHSLIEDSYEVKLGFFLDAIKKELPDVIALQEVNQSLFAPIVDPGALSGFHPCENATILRGDNHALRVAEELKIHGIHYHWTWAFLKIGYGRFEEGIALLTKEPIKKTKVITVSKGCSSKDWRTRRIVGIQTTDDTWYYSVHFGFWEDADSFADQFDRTFQSLPQNEQIYLMGDFNCPSHIRGEGYDHVQSRGFYDTYLLAREKDDGFTVKQKIDGWEGLSQPSRIDYIFTTNKDPIESCKTIFNGQYYPIVSDHFGVYVKIKGSNEI